MGLKVLVAGRGGQGVLFVTRVLSSAALEEGIPVIGSETHGMAQRGGSVVAHMKLGFGFRSPLIMRGGADALLSLDFTEGLRNLGYLGEGSMALINGTQPLPDAVSSLTSELGVKTFVIDATGTAVSLGSYLSLNAVMLGALASTGLLPFDASRLRDSVGRIGRKEVRKTNIEAFDAGREWMEKRRCE